jgi:multiple sugar transport system permease protein
MKLTDRKYGAALLIPALLMVGLLFVYPIAYSFYMSFHDKDPFSAEAAPYVGLENYEMVIDDPLFWDAFKKGLIFGCTTVFFQVVLGVSIALLLNKPFAGQSVARGLVLLPYVIPTIGGALIWKWMYNDLLGIINRLLLLTGLIDRSIAWIGDPDWAMIGVIIVAVWKLFPFVVICVLARLQTINQELYDAAKVDGASVFSQFKDITLPQLKHILFVVILLRFVWMFTEFETIWLLTSGGPVHTTTTLPILAYLSSFKHFELSLGMTITVTMMIFLIFIASIFFKIYKVEEEVL